MSIARNIPLKYFVFVPAISFALLGAYDISADLLRGRIEWLTIIFNAALFMPLLFRRWYILLGCGVVFGVMSAYLFLCGSILLRSELHRPALELFGIWLMMLWLVLCSIAMFYAGHRLKTARGIHHRLN